MNYSKALKWSEVVVRFQVELTSEDIDRTSSRPWFSYLIAASDAYVNFKFITRLTKPQQALHVNINDRVISASSTDPTAASNNFQGKITKSFSPCKLLPASRGVTSESTLRWQQHCCQQATA
jgi:hypothetical protein